MQFSSFVIKIIDLLQVNRCERQIDSTEQLLKILFELKRNTARSMYV